MKLITHFHAVLRFRMCGAIPPICMAWCLVKHRDNFEFTALKAKDDGNGNNKNYEYNAHSISIKKFSVSKETFLVIQIKLCDIKYLAY
jgi:hypothetical protein